MLFMKATFSEPVSPRVKKFKMAGVAGLEPK
jgi:hypothetical protein